MAKKNDNTGEHITSIGGQAIIEGVMMRGPYKTAMSCRKSDGEILTEVNENGTKKHAKILMLPVIRGCINFFDSMIVGMKALMFSANLMDIEGDEDEEPSKFDQWLEDKLGDKIKDIVIYVSLAISLVFSVGLFMLLPAFLTKGAEFLGGMVPALSPIVSSHAFTGIFEGIVRMAIFLGYMIAISQMKDIKRLFQYHGAEHKSIACYEAGEELIVENVRRHTRFHPRCGTNFLLFVMIISIILFACLPRFDDYSGIVSVLLRMGTRLLLLPVVSGLSYEVIKLAGRSKSKAVCALIQPGLWLQRLTTREPDDSQIEVAIQSLLAVIPENKEDDKW